MGRDGVVGLLLLLISAIFYLQAQALPRPSLVPIGPGFYPEIVLVCLAIFSLLLIAWDFLGRRTVSGRLPGKAPAKPTAPPRYGMVLNTFVIFSAYVFALPLLGYLLSTLLFVGVLQALLKPPRAKEWVLLATVALATAFVTYWVFEGYLHVLLPRGRWTGLP